MASPSLLIRAQLAGRSLATKTARRSTTWLPTSSAAVPALLRIVTTLLVRYLKMREINQKLLEMIKRELEMHRLNTRSENRVQMAAGRLCSHAFNYGGAIGTHLIVGGYDVKGPQLIEVSSDGNMYSLPYHTTGSGSLAAMAILETGYRDGLTQE